jgi:hypothetical protein
MAVIIRLNIEEEENIQASVWVGFAHDAEKPVVVNRGECNSEEAQSSSE